MSRSALAAACASLLVAAAVQRTDLNAQAAASKLTTVLADLSRSVSQGASISRDALPSSVQDAMRSGRLRINADNEVQVYILLSDVTDATLSQLASAGVTIEIKDVGRRRVQAHLPVSRLQIVAQLPIVDAIRLPTYARSRIGQTTTEADPILYTDAVRGQFKLDGTGVRVGVVSDGLKGVFETGCTSCTGASGGPISTGDLPATIGNRSATGVLTSVSGGIVGRSFRANGDLEGLPPANPACGFSGAGAEGTAVLEVVHDLAPGARLSFANADTDLAFAQAVNFLAASNDVVLDDVGFYGEPYDGTSAVSSNTAAALNHPSFPIRAYFTAAGNDADRHYFGTYTDSGIEGTTVSGINSSGRLHLFQRTADTTDVLGLGAQPYNLIQLPQNGQAAIFLTWDDPFGASSNNYDLYLVQQSTGSVVARGTDIQTGTQDPAETIDYVNRGSQDFFRIVVQNVQNGAQPRRLNMFSIQPQCAAAGPQPLAPPRHERHNYNTASRSVAAQADAGGSPVSVITVGAICSGSSAAAGKFPSNAPNESCLDTSNTTIDFFSGRGPTVDGRVKPDIAAIDGVSITGAGGFGSPFVGTSAAVPHLGGIAALLLQSAPCLLNRTTSKIEAPAARTKVRSLILANALKLNSAAPDNTFGAGRADAYAAVRATLPVRNGPPSVRVDGNSPFGASLTPDQLGFSDPTECPLSALSWTGGCGTSPGITMTCPFGTSSVAVSATNNFVGFSPPIDMEITVTDYSMEASPSSATVSPGGVGTYAVTVTPQSGPFNSAVTLSCANGNLPPQTTCSFDPPTVTPGASPARSTLTLSTTASASVLFDVDPRSPSQWARFSTSRLMPIAIGWPALMAVLWAGTRRRDRRRTVCCAAISVTLACVAGGAVYGGVSANAAAPEPAMASGIAIFPSSLDFGSQTITTSTVPKLVSVTNIGADTLNFTNISNSGDFRTTTSCSTTLAPGASCAVAVTFTPTAIGSRTGTLGFVNDAPGSPHTVSLTGTGVAAPATTGGTPAGSYLVTVSGVTGTLTHTAGVTLVVQ